MKVYVEAQSKAALIRRLAAGEEISGFNYSMFGGGGQYMLDDTLEDGTIIAIYSQMSQGNPVAKSWGTWTNGVLKAESFAAESAPSNFSILRRSNREVYVMCKAGSTRGLIPNMFQIIIPFVGTVIGQDLIITHTVVMNGAIQRFIHA